MKQKKIEGESKEKGEMRKKMDGILDVGLEPIVASRRQVEKI
jgi:hypothetical protein